jgi:APA family basic amino acid/polyamine antiporter
MAGATSEASLIPTRKLGLAMCVALVVGNMVGSGVFQLPRDLAPLGWNSVYGWLMTIGGTICLAIVLIRLARGRADSCGAYSYPAAAFGPGTGFVVAWSYWITCWTANAALAIAAVNSLAFIVPGLGQPMVPLALALAFLWLFTFVNCLGVREAGKVQVVTTVLKLVPLFFAIVAAAWLLGTGEVAPVGHDSVPVSAVGIQTAATFTLFAMLSFESAAAAGDRIENPERNVPRATLLGTVIIGVIYLLSCSAVTLLLPPEALRESPAPFALFFSTLIDPTLGQLVAVFMAIAALGALNGLVLIQAEMPVAMARERLLPAWLVRFNRNEIPYRIHIVSSGLATVVVLANYAQSMSDLFQFMMLVTTSVSIIFYGVCALASLKLVAAGRLAGSPGFVAVALLGVAYSAWAFYGAGIRASLWGLAMTAAAIPVYLVMRAASRSSPATAGPPGASPESAA